MMSPSFKGARIIRSSWIEEGGRRLDCNPYMSGAMESRDALRNLSVPKIALNEVCSGIFDSGRESRSWVNDAKYGVPYMGSSGISLADTALLPFISKKQTARNPRLLLQQGWSLITRSGTIGRMAYVRSDMEGLACSEDVLRVVPDALKISPGYLYAFLSSHYGIPLIVSGTYGAIIQHIEPVHIADLPVPRFDSEFELQVSKLIEAAAFKRSQAVRKRRDALAMFEGLIGWDSAVNFSITDAIPASETMRRMDAFHHSTFVRSGTSALSSQSSERLGNLVESVYEPNRGSRLKVTDADYGVPFLSSSAVFELNPVGDYLISSSRTPNIEQLILTGRDLLIPRSGQVGGIIGRAVLPLSRNVGNAASEHLIRVRCIDESDAAYLWAVLASEPGYRAVVGTAFGSSIPSLDASLIAQMRVPWLSSEIRKTVSDLVMAALSDQGEGVELELLGISMLEQKIAEGA